MQQLPAHDDSGTAEFIDFFGFIYWGLVCSTVLFGVSLCQGYFYFSNYNDRFTLKIYVAFLLMLDVSSTLVWMIGIQRIVIRNWGASTSVASAQPFATAESVSIITITFLTQMFFARRVYLLDSHRKRIPVIIVIRLFRMLTTTFDQIMQREFKILNIFESGFAAVSDIVATIAMCFRFVETAMDTRRLTSFLRRIMIYTVNRGVVVTVVQVLTLALFLYSPHGLHWFPFHMCVGKLYVNTLLAMLNARQRLRSYTVSTIQSNCDENPSTLVIHSIVHSTDEIPASSD
ncbi:hypothetical protein BD410DRAFT_125301 [Rickenella mellea]|uniref:DUF6534 domain-containing protein n=2 Tax=Rickenella mellea TaxID=50990 RepID=A0A4Y7PJK1_9AGAM|nr:hypothetical protein BD410DRAFT_125301 [Rickenella mellea]